MKSFAPFMRAAAERMIAEWCARGSPIDLHDETRRLTLRILLDAALSGGEDFPGIEETSRHIDRFIDGVGRFFITDFLPMPDWMRPSTERRGGPSTAWMRDRIAAMVTRRRKDAQTAATQRDDLVELLLDAVDPETGRRMDDGLVRDNIMGFIAAGHETSAYALSWALWLVASHEPTQQRILDEIAAVAGNDPIESVHLDRLIFLRQVMQETMRLFPGAAAVIRTSARDIELKGRKIRKGTMVAIATHAFHRRAEFWPDPHAFDPDRFAPDRQAQGRPRLAYMPFSAGPRVCMGAGFAMTELMVVLATVVRATRLDADPARPVRIGVRVGGFIADAGMWMKPVLRTRLD